MAKLAIAFLTALLLAACNPPSGEAGPIPEKATETAPAAIAGPVARVQKLDATTIARAIGLGGAGELDTSGAGKTRVRWSLSPVGAQSSMDELEVIGDDQTDADVIGWHCSKFNKEGDVDLPIAPDSVCGQVFQKALSVLVDEPAGIAASLLAEAGPDGKTAAMHVAPFQIETDGEFFFLRRR